MNGAIFRRTVASRLMPLIIPQPFCTDTLPPATRMEQVRDGYARLNMAVDLTPLVDAHAFRLDLTSIRLNESASLGSGLLSPYTARRSRALAARAGIDAVMVTRFSQPFRVTCGPMEQVDVTPGDTLVAPMDAAFDIAYPTAGCIQTVWVSRAALRPLSSRLEGPAHRVRASAHLDVLFAYAASLQHQAYLDTPLAHLASGHLTDLLALSLGVQGDAAEQARIRGERAARFAALRSDTARTYGNPQLSVEHLAQRHHMSVRQVQRLFEEDGTTFTLYLQERRLEHVRRALADPANMRKLIASIAYEAGFSNLTAFNRLFKQRFGATPTQVREAVTGSQHA